MLRFFAILALSLATTGPFASAESAPAPAPVKPDVAEAKISLKDFLAQLPGTWSGMQYTRSPSGGIMPVEVRESYVWEKGADGAPDVLVGDLSYTVKSNGVRRVFSGKSRTWVDKDGKGRSVVEQHGEKTRFVALIRVDTLVFIPEGELDKPKSMTGVHFVTQDGVAAMEVRGFQTGPEGTYLIKGLLKRGDNPVVAGPGK